MMYYTPAELEDFYKTHSQNSHAAALAAIYNLGAAPAALPATGTPLSQTREQAVQAANNLATTVNVK